MKWVAMSALVQALLHFALFAIERDPHKPPRETGRSKSSACAI
jgi:hypothetical protein